MLYTLIWKFALIAYTRADTDGEPFDQATISRSAVRRLSTRLEACSAEAKAMVERYRSRGEEVPEQALARLRKQIGPDITLSDSGALVMTEPLLNMFQMAGCYSTHPPATMPETPECELCESEEYKYPTPPKPGSSWGERLAEGLLDEYNAAFAPERDKRRRYTLENAIEAGRLQRARRRRRPQ